MIHTFPVTPAAAETCFTLFTFPSAFYVGTDFGYKMVWLILISKDRSTDKRNCKGLNKDDYKVPVFICPACRM